MLVYSVGQGFRQSPAGLTWSYCCTRSEASSGSLSGGVGGGGLESCEDLFPHMSGHQLILALSWDPSWGSFLKHLCMASFYNLGFLSAWQPGSKVVPLERAKWASWSCPLFKPQPQESHRMTATRLFLEQSLRTLARLVGRKNRLHPLMGSSEVL